MVIDLAYGVPNEVANKAAMAGIETTRGVLSTPDFRLKGQFALTNSRSLVRTETATGGYDRFRGLKKGVETRAGTYGESMDFNSAAVMAHIAVGNAGTGSAVSGATGAYEWHIETNFDRDDLGSISVAHGIDGLAYIATGVGFTEWTLVGDITDADNAFKISGPLFSTSNAPRAGDFEGTATAGTTTGLTQTGAGWTIDAHIGKFVTLNYPDGTGAVREISDNTADTLTWIEPVSAGDTPGAGTTFYIAANLPAIAVDEDVSLIPVEGAQFFVDLASGTIGTTEVTDRIISVTLTQQISRTEKKFWSGTSNKSGRGARVISGAVTFEYDRWDEWKRWDDNALLALRIKSTGEVLDDDPETLETFQIDLPAVRYDTWTEGTRDSNMTQVLAFVAELPDSDPIMSWDIVNGLATLP